MELLDPSNTVFVAVLHLLHNRLSYASYLSWAVFHDSLRVPRTLALFCSAPSSAPFCYAMLCGPRAFVLANSMDLFFVSKTSGQKFRLPLRLPHVTVIAHSARPGRSLGAHRDIPLWSPA